MGSKIPRAHETAQTVRAMTYPMCSPNWYSTLMTGVFPWSYEMQRIATRRLGSKPRLQSSAQIGVQPLAVARRKVSLGGRRRLQAGRPSKSTFFAEHSLAKKRRRVAPHSLGQCVDANISLGKTHPIIV